MNVREVNALLAHAALVDLRVAALLRDAADAQVQGEQAARVATEWHEFLGDVEYADALDALRGHYSVSTESLLPAHITEGVQEILSERRWETPRLAPDELELCLAANVSPEEFEDRRLDPGFEEWVAHLRFRWMGVES